MAQSSFRWDFCGYSGGLCDSNGVKPRLGTIMHHFYSHSIGENLATGHTYCQGTVGYVVSSLVAMCQLKFAVEEGRTNREGLLLYNVPHVFSVHNRIQCHVISTWEAK